MKKSLAQLIPLLARGMAPAAAVASSLLSPIAQGGAGDLDPSFGDVGRMGPLIDFDGPAWSVQPGEDDGLWFAGGDFDWCASSFYCSDGLDFGASGFFGQLSGTGSLEWVSTLAILSSIQVLDMIRQRDGKVIGVGRRVSRDGRRQTPDPATLAVFRLETDGLLDATFGVGGVFQLPFDVDTPTAASSVVLEPNGRIVVAGERTDRWFPPFRFAQRSAIVLRLLADGTLDDSFGVSGVFSNDSQASIGSPTHVLRTGDGGYRVASNHEGRCQVVALTADGVVDASFGSSGIAALEVPSGAPVYCNAMVARTDGRLLVAGSADGEEAFATRLLMDGARDPGFAANEVASAMMDATALALREDGSILVAGIPRDGFSGALIMRLQASGELDPLFGENGSTWIDLPSDHRSMPIVHDISVLPDGRVLAAGGDHVRTSPPFGGQPFVIRLLGDAGGNAPGVIGVKTPSIEATKEGQQAVVTVRRTGGSFGSVSVAYQTATGGPVPATGGEDYTPVTDRVSWADGDTRDQEIRVPIASDAGSPEESEQFLVVLSDPDGGAGLGMRNATVEILGDGDPHGQFAIEVSQPVITESESITVLVLRNYYATGAVSVTLTPGSGTATSGDDFDVQPVTFAWADGESDPKFISIPIRDDPNEEPSETFTVELSNPTGGAIIGPRSSATITIGASDEPPPPPLSGTSGGGGLGFLSLLLLGIAQVLNSVWLKLGSNALLRR
jgi:uncharacterized delta-60 repeat protein